MPRLLALLCAAVVFVTLTAESSSCAKNNTSKSSGGSAAQGTAKPSGKGNVAVYQAGATARTKELEMTLSGLQDPYTSPNQFTQPKAGNRFVLIHVSARNADSREHTVNEFSFHVKTADNHVYNPAFVVSAGQQFRAAALRAGEIGRLCT